MQSRDKSFDKRTEPDSFPASLPTSDQSDLHLTGVHHQQSQRLYNLTLQLIRSDSLLYSPWPFYRALPGYFLFNILFHTKLKEY